MTPSHTSLMILGSSRTLGSNGNAVDKAGAGYGIFSNKGEGYFVRACADHAPLG